MTAQKGGLRPGESDREYFFRMAREMAFPDGLALVADGPAYEAQLARSQRRERLDRAKPEITGHDYARIVAGTMDPTAAFEIVRDWLASDVQRPRGSTAEPYSFLVLHGKYGCGKTLACAWAIAEASGIYLTGKQLRDLHTSWEKADRDELYTVLNARLVVLDDLGTDKVDERSPDMLFEFANARQRFNQYSLITTNWNEEQLREAYGDRALDRIRRLGAILPVGGDNLRLRDGHG